MQNSTKIITQHWNDINPLKIEDYLNVGGYKALHRFVKKMSPRQAIEEIKKSGLCGRGGAGYPTGQKLEMVGVSGATEKYFICNLDESEPGTYKDRMLVDYDPHLLIEGVIIVALSVGAYKAYIYINGNYKKQKDILEIALAQAREKNFWGAGILGSEYDLEIEIFSGAGAYICGEETALINSIEGNRGEPKLRPPYPTDAGLFGKPTAVNNAETIANIPWIISQGGEKYAKIGAACSPGTKLYILGGTVKNPGVVEAPTGITIRELIYDFGGGLPEGKDFWFAQIGGASGKLVVENELDIPLTFSRDCPIPLGSGAVLVVDKSVDIHDLILSWTGFFRRESCGKCVPCREGTFRLDEIAGRLKDGKISDRDKQAVYDILWTLNNTTFCPLGKFAATAFSDAISKLKILGD
ncbi:MAG: NADH-ubiquinone oxidoreductase-F iron-sulfur binding region domain-containing protein [Candidatus Pacebacteria bacterium]|nr:NADH-ubiquinone oxidoreductase-F iron-sulfur binding region domain-containing protein [Candidatus Paceibacterota bacterium]MDR3583574.1 NADH-ubiquinone oxidoreductase-F iron-sulfur binding region domain-containing protein [Candidatus Paceibacterota bacterium]